MVRPADEADGQGRYGRPAEPDPRREGIPGAHPGGVHGGRDGAARFSADERYSGASCAASGLGSHTAAASRFRTGSRATWPQRSYCVMYLLANGVKPNSVDKGLTARHAFRAPSRIERARSDLRCRVVRRACRPWLRGPAWRTRRRRCRRTRRGSPGRSACAGRRPRRAWIRTARPDRASGPWARSPRRS